MPPVLCLHPALLDQSFPRSLDQLETVQVALANIVELAENDKVFILVVDIFKDYFESFEWQDRDDYGFIHDIWKLLSTLLLEQRYTLEPDLGSVAQNYNHPLPPLCEPSDNNDLWQFYVGKTYLLHKQHYKTGHCIGITCYNAFSGNAITQYPSTATVDRFPIVGPHNISTLQDPYEWIVPHNIHNQDVTFDQAKRNCLLLGAERVTPPRGAGGSHYMVIFPGGRSWPLDSNFTDIPLTYLLQLVPITGLPINVIKCTLITGLLPGKTILIPIAN